MKSFLRAHPSWLPPLFYGGTLISSVGSMTFTVCLLAFMLRAGFALWDASLIIGLCRIFPILTMTLFGQWADSLAPRQTVLLTEVVAGLGSVGILWSWKQGHAGYLALLLFSVSRAILLSFQSGSRARIVKELGGSAYASQSRHAIWLNKATQGAVLFAGILAVFATRLVSFESVILFDAATFLINGTILCLLPIDLAQGGTPAHPMGQSSIGNKFIDLYRHNSRAAILDLVLALTMMGTISFTSRIAGGNSTWFSVFVITYGLSVWISGFLERSSWISSRSLSLWIGLGASYVALGLFPEQGLLTLIPCLIKDLCYWLLFHRITAYIQADTPTAIIGSVTQARTVQMITILAFGELLVGAWQPILPIAYDGLLRGVLALTVAGVLCVQRLPMGIRHERPAL